MVFLLIFLALGVSASKKPPNIIFMLVDDLGWDDVSFHGSPQIPTPNMDVLAGDGVILNNYYVQHLCTPSRAALMTGLYPIHNGLQDFVPNVAQPYGLPLYLKVMPQFFKDMGYETHMIGKWHLGYFRKEYTPTYRGFDSFYGYYNGGEDYYNHSITNDNRTGLDFWLNTEPLFNETGNYSTHLFTERAKFLIKSRNAAKPLFLYLAYQSVHGPLEAPEENIMKFPYIGEENRTIFAGTVDALDQSVGEVLETLYEADMLDNTIIVLSTDNGGLPFGDHSNRGYNFPLRGAKGTLWEGGTRGSAFIWSPLLNQNRRVSDQMLHITDWLPTLYSAAGGNPVSLGKVDGYDMWTQLSYNLPSSRYEVLYNIDPTDLNSALRYTNYKLVLGTYEDGEFDQRFRTTGGSRPYGDLEIAMAQSKAARVLKGFYNRGNFLLPRNWRQKATVNCVSNNGPKNFVSQAPPYLFDLTKDPCELNNIANAEAGLVDFLKQRLQSYASSSIAPLNKPTDPRGYPENLNGTWGPWIQ
ncbi:arylsulfatase B [Ixodes scapularis]|uniref:arylsulfatase B n=1 Tax=Ixodes scapularis TaxID=6945 RepID=UPI001AD67970|nr:arylsulfatase B [Ixodes scapularis]